MARCAVMMIRPYTPIIYLISYLICGQWKAILAKDSLYDTVR